MAEVPVVVVNVMRMGPSTGMATNVAQGDVQQARWGTHGDHPAIVLCPATVLECFELTVTAFNHAERFRNPVILLMDEMVAHTREKVVLPDPEDVEVINRRRPTVPPDWYVPYKTDGSLIPNLADLGQGYRYHVTGMTHDERGFPHPKSGRSEPLLCAAVRKDKPAVRLHRAGQAISARRDAEFLIIAYGCMARSARAAVRLGRERGMKIGLLQLMSIWPFPRRAVVEAMTDKKGRLSWSS